MQYLLFKFFCFAVAYFSLFATPIFATGQNLKVMTFNSGYRYPESLDDEFCPTQAHIDHAVRDTQKLAQYIKDQQIEVALIQEMGIVCRETNMAYNRVEALAQTLNAMGYPMQFAVVPANVNLKVATFSRYPIDQSRVRSVDLQLENRSLRPFLITPIQTDVGEITFYNLHTRDVEACNGVRQFFAQVNRDNIPYRILGGDFNVDMSRFVHSCNVAVELAQPYHVNINTSIDFILLPKNSPFSFISSRKDGSAAAPHSDHDPVISDIKLDLPVITPPPTATPTPVPLQKSCSVQLAAIGRNDQTTTVQLQASSSSVSTESVGLVIKRQDNRKITQVPIGVTEQTYQGSYYYRLTQNPCQAGGGTTCMQTIQLPVLEEGSYHVFCDLAQSPQACSGNPNCSENGGNINCTALGFSSCSNKDHASFTVSPLAKPGDADKDGDVDIFDYNKVIEFFGQDKCEYNFVETCRIDIFDFNQVVSHFGT